MKTVDNLVSAKANPVVKPPLFSRRRDATSIVAILLLCASLILTACGQTPTKVTEAYIPTATTTDTPEPIATSMPTDTPIPTATDTPEPTATPVPLEGRLFFDMNGSGLMDQATFNYDPARLTDERQPLQPDLLAAVLDYVNAHPDLQTGDLITLDEPGLTGYTVCVADNCTVTDAGGSFTIANPGTSSSPRVAIADPNAGTPALEMRYVNLWNGAVVIPAYEMNGVQVPEQHLNDTEVVPISSQLNTQRGVENEIGLMQGYLTAPFPLEYPAYILGYFDVDGRYPWDRNGTSHNYLGETYNWTWGNPYSSVTSDVINKATLVFPGVTGTQDGHDALDIRLDLMTPVFAALGGTVQDIFSNGPEIKVVHTINGEEYTTFYGHLDTNNLILRRGQPVYRGQLIAFSSNVGDNNNLIPILHFALVKTGLITIDEYTGDTLIDPFRNISGVDYPLASEVSSFTVDNFFIDASN